VRRRSELDPRVVPGLYADLRDSGLGILPGAQLGDRDETLRAGEPVVCMPVELPPFFDRGYRLGFQGFEWIRVHPDDRIDVVRPQPSAWPDDEEPR
jgi:hypothetical protein